MGNLEGVEFTEDNIYRLFGNEAAEGESLSRLKQYYFKNKTYDQISGKLPLRLLVGHKGIGKSALFKVAISEDPERGNLPISIRPDDVVGIGQNTTDFLALINEWKLGLIKISSEFTDFGYGWEIHPAYRWALQPDSIEDILRQIE